MSLGKKLIAATICALLMLAHSPNEAVVADKAFSVTIVEVRIDGPESLDAMSQAGLDVSNVSGGTATVYVMQEGLQWLDANRYEYVAVGEQPSPPEWDTASKGLGIYHSYAALTQELEDYANAYPDICRLSSLGRTTQGRELWTMLITDNPDTEEDEPEFKYVATIHGDESVGTELCLYFIDMLLSGYETDERITALIDATSIWIVPLMNPDGLELGSRYNAQAQDLNRSFPAYPDDFQGTSFDSEIVDFGGFPVEVAQIMQWGIKNNFVLSGNFHTGALVANYPYDDDGKGSFNYAATPDDELFIAVSKAYSMHNIPMWNSTQFQDGITNGSQWYEISGGMQDWNYRFVACNDVTLEVSVDKKPSASQLPDLWDDNRESMLSYIEAVHTGLRGIVTDSLTATPVWCKVTIGENEHSVFSDPDVGDYYRMLTPGTYTATFEAQGYETVTVPDINIVEGTAARLDIDMPPLTINPDVNEDGKVDAADVQIVINCALGIDMPWQCDLNGDGFTNAVDVQIVINAALGIL